MNREIRTVSFNQDDYLQCVLLPLDNYESCAIELDIIDNTETQSLYGYTDIQIRDIKQKNTPLSSLRISPQQLISTLDFLQPFDQVYKYFGGSKEQLCNNVYALGETKKIVVFYELTEEEYLKHVWFDIYSFNCTEEDLQKLFISLSKLNDFIVCDYSSCLILNLDNIESLNIFIQNILN